MTTYLLGVLQIVYTRYTCTADLDDSCIYFRVLVILKFALRY